MEKKFLFTFGMPNTGKPSYTFSKKLRAWMKFNFNININSLFCCSAGKCFGEILFSTFFIFDILPGN